MTALAPPEARDERTRELREALEAVTPAMIAAAGGALRTWNWRAPVSETGPILVEALAAALAASGLLAELDALRRKVAEAEARSMPHMCRDDHPEIRHADSGDDERCPVCRERDRADCAEDELAAATARATEAEARASELVALIRECRLADAHAARTGDEGRWDRAFDALCRAEKPARAALSPADPSQSAEGAGGSA